MNSNSLKKIHNKNNKKSQVLSAMTFAIHLFHPAPHDHQSSSSIFSKPFCASIFNCFLVQVNAITTAAGFIGHFIRAVLFFTNLANKTCLLT